MLALEKVLLSSAYYYRPKAQGQQEFTTPGTYNFIVPANVSSISMVAVGGGAGGAQTVDDGGGGGGGALAYSNNVTVTPGEILTVVVGAGGAPGNGSGIAGGASSVTRSGVGSQIYDNFEVAGNLGSKWISSRGVSIKTWGSGSGQAGFTSSGISGSSGYLRFGEVTGGFRQATTQPQDLTYANKIKLRYIYGNGSNGGEQVDAGEYLGIALSTSVGNATDNTGYTNIIYPFSLVYSWTDGEITIPPLWQKPGVYIRIYQLDSSGSEYDHIGIDNFSIEYTNRLLVAAGGGQPGVGPRGGNGGIPAGNNSDSYASSVVMLLTGDGVDGSRNFIDTSNNPKTVSNFQDLNGTGYPLQTTRFKKFGSGSIDFNGVSSFYVNGGTDFVLGGDFTIEGWLWVNNENQAYYQTIWELNDYRNGILFRFGSANDGFWVNGVNRGRLVPSFPPLQWHHFAVVRYGSTLTVYANGSPIISYTETGVLNSVGGPIRIGESNHTGYQFSPPMYLDEFRITKGVARYTGSFNPPSTSFSDTTSLTNFPGFPGGKGGNGTNYYGGSGSAGGGGGAGGYTGAGGAGGDASGNPSYSGTASTGGGGGGGTADGSRAYGGGGTGIKGISNNGTARGGGGSSYNAELDYISTNINTQVDFVPVTLSYAWGNFINTYGVWPSTNNNGTYDRGWYAPYTGTYTIEYTADNYIEIRANGKLVGSESNFGGSTVSSFTVNQGIVTLSFYVRNDGGPAGFAVTIRDRNNTLLWDTRTYASKSTINRAIKSVAGGTAGVQADGGFPGGGGGGHDSGQTAGYGGGGAVRIIWGSNRSYPYNAGDVTPVALASTLGLILYYDANNAASYNGGSTIYDISGNNNHGTISLGYSPATVPNLGSNKVIRFPASSNTKINFTADELTSSTITVEMWAIAYSFAGGMFFGFYRHDVWTQDGHLGFNTSNSDLYGISASRINSLNVTGRWAHYVFVMNAGDYSNNKIYINGVLQSLGQQRTYQVPGYNSFNSGVARIGGWTYDNNYQQVMDVGVFKIYNRELTQGEVTTNYNEKLVQYSTAVYYSGLWGKRVEGYFSDNVNYFASQGVVEARVFNSMEGISSYRDQYSWEWTGYFKAPADGTYTFYTSSDDASYLWIGTTAVSGYSTGNALVNNGGLHGWRTASGAIYLTQGSHYPIRIQFGENYGADAISVSVYGPGLPSGYTYGDGYFFHDDTNKI